MTHLLNNQTTEQDRNGHDTAQPAVHLCLCMPIVLNGKVSNNPTSLRACMSWALKYNTHTHTQ